MRKKVTFVEWAGRYIAERRVLGFGMRTAGTQLLAFGKYADKGMPGSPLTIELIVAWARTSRRSSALTWGRRLEVVRPFVSWLRQHDIRHEVPPSRYFGSVHRRLPPHIYTEAEISEILREASQLAPRRGLRPKAVQALLGLLACTGMRVSEAIALRRMDVVLDDALLVVRETKFHKSRLVPVHPSAVRELRRYMALRDRLAPAYESDAFFVIDSGAKLTYTKVRTAFCRLRIRLGWNRLAGRRPRVHDLRHTFASRRLLRWHEERIDVDRRILDLSTYLGHAKASDTYWYLSGFPELMALAGRRFENFMQGEVRS